MPSPTPEGRPTSAGGEGLPGVGRRLRIVDPRRRRRRVEEAEEAARLRSELLTCMSHEIRTTLNGVLGMLSLLVDTGLDDEQRDYAVTAYRSGEALLTLLDDIVELSKIEAGTFGAEPVDFDVRELVEEVARLFEAAAEAKGLELACLADMSGPVVHGDAARVRHVLTSLVSNAVKFTEDGDVVVRAMRRQGTAVRFEVADTGVGLPPQDLERLFASARRRFGGPGLGLDVSRRVVQLLGGRLGVEALPGRGSTFWFEVPLPSASKDTAAPPLRRSLEPLRVLVVDDDAATRDALVRMARSWHMVPTAVEDGLAALAAARSAPFDVALVDMDVRDMDGGTLALALRASIVPTPRVVLLTGPGHRGSHVAPQVKADGAVSKPVRESQLYDVLATLFGDAHPEQRAGAERTSPSPPPRGRVLLAEDNSVNQRVARLFLEQLGFEVDVVDDGAAAVRAVGARSYDAVLMDFHMPTMDGYRAVREIRRRERAGRRVPIVALTASARPADRERALAAGMDEHLAKPVDREQLSEVLARVMVDRSPHRLVLDVEVLEGLRELGGAGGRGFFSELRELLSEDVVKELASMRAALDAGRLDEIAALAHRLKGTGGYLGAHRVVELCTALESSTKGGAPNADEVAAVIDELETVLHEVIAVFEAEEQRAQS